MTDYNNFLTAIKCGNRSNVKNFYQKEFLNKLNESQLAPIHLATINNDGEIVKWLLKKRCNIELCNDNGWRAIHFATKGGHKEIVRILIDNYCDIDCLTKDNDSPLDLAISIKNYQFIQENIDDNINRHIGMAIGMSCSRQCCHDSCLSLFVNEPLVRKSPICCGEFADIYQIDQSYYGRNFIIKSADKNRFGHKLIKLGVRSTDESVKYVEKSINECLKLLNHQRIVQIFGSIDSITSLRITIFMEYLVGGSIKDKIDSNGAIPPNIIIKYSKHILQALAFLHNNKIVHRNIQPSNVLLDSFDNCKLAGFGWSCFLDDGKMDGCKDFWMMFGGIYRYMAPEMINKTIYSYTVDIWSLGASLVHMLTGKPPNHKLDIRNLVYKIGISKVIECRPGKQTSIEVKALIESMLNQESFSRPSALDLLEYEIMKNAQFDDAIDAIENKELNNDNSSHKDCIDMLKIAIENKKVGKAIGLTCNVNCDHRFCLSSLISLKFKEGKLIGTGGFGKVFQMIDSLNGRIVVMKSTEIIVNDNNKDEARRIEHNINNYRNFIKHHAIVYYYGAIRTETNNFLIFMEFMDAGSIKDEILKLGYLSEIIIKKYCKQILEGLQFLHNKSIIHRDIKPDNILMNTLGQIKLTDFGLSVSLKTITRNIAKTFCGTPNYMAPEIVNSEPYDYPADIWSLGATVVEMLTGSPPYSNIEPYAVIFRIGTTKKIEFEPCQPLSNELKQFLDKMLQPFPHKRLAATSLLKNNFLSSL